MYIDSKQCVVDWLGFAKAATVEDWLITTIFKKISYPIIEVYGERYWQEIKNRLSVWFIKYMETV